jgi:hypothetical protein
VQFFQFAADISRDRRVADVGVDLAAGGDTDSQRLEFAGQVDFVGGNDHPPSRNFAVNQLGTQVLPLGNELHLGRNLAGAGGLELGICHQNGSPSSF